MVDIIQVALIGTLVFIGLVGISILGYLLVKYYDDKKKNPDYIKKSYQDFIEGMQNNCPDSIYNYDLILKTTKQSEGRSLGKIQGYLYLQVYKDSEKGSIVEKINKKEEEEKTEMRHYVAFLPKKNEFSLFKPQTWTKKLFVAIIKADDLPEGLNGNLYWAVPGIEWFKWYVYSIGEDLIEKPVLAKKIKYDVGMDFAVDAYKDMAKIANSAMENDTQFKKGKKILDELETRRNT